MNPLSLVETHTVRPTFPIEVVEEIIDQASDDYRSLRSLSLLSKDLLARAHIHLFTGITIRNVNQMEQSHEFLDSHPWIPPLVQRVTLFSSTEGCITPNIPLLDICPVHLFERLPNLRMWRINAHIYPFNWVRAPRFALHHRVLSLYKMCSINIQELELESLPFEDVSHFVRLIQSFTSLRTLTCSSLQLVQKRRQTLVPGTGITNKPVLTLQHLRVNVEIDIHLIEYLLHNSAATLSTLALPLESEHFHGGVQIARINYFESCRESIGQLSNLSSLTLVVFLDGGRSKSIEHIQSMTRTLEQAASGNSLTPAVYLQFLLEPIAAFGGRLAWDSSLLHACTALETAVLRIKGIKVEFIETESYLRRAGRAEFWSQTIVSAFPRLTAQGILTWPRSRPSDPPGHEYGVTCLISSPDSKWIATGSSDGTIIIWDTESGTIMHEWLGHWDRVEALDFSPNSQHLVSAGGESGATLIVWAPNNGRVSKVAILASVDLEKPKTTAAIACAWSPDGTWIASACQEGPVHVWDALTFQHHCHSSPHASEICPSDNGLLQWSPDSHYLMWTYARESQDHPNFCDDELEIWSPLRPEEQPLRLPSHPTFPILFGITAFSFDPRRRRISICLRSDIEEEPDSGEEESDSGEEESDSEEDEPHGHSGCILIWDIASAEVIATLEHTSEVWDVSFSPDGRSLLSLSKDGMIRTWDTDSWKEVASFKGGEEDSSNASFQVSPDGKYVASTFKNDNSPDSNTLRLWRTGETSCIAAFTEHDRFMGYVGHITLTFSPNGEFLASGDTHGRVHIRRLSDFI